jgi:uncharacterized membrane protein YraQ (UPF0718 family)
MKTPITKFLIITAATLGLLVPTISATATAAASNGTISNTAATKCKNSTPAELNKCLKTNPIVQDIQTIVNFLSALVGIVVTAALILGGIQYSGSRDNPQAMQAAKGRIQNAIIALVMYFLIFAFLQWLIPGGVFA